MTMNIDHDSGPANDVMEIVGVQARQAPHGRFDALCTRAGPFAALLAPSADIAIIGA
jgi:hypothetical protein